MKRASVEYVRDDAIVVEDGGGGKQKHILQLSLSSQSGGIIRCQSVLWITSFWSKWEFQVLHANAAVRQHPDH